MGQPEQLEGNSRWYLMDSQGDMVVRVRPGMPLGETPSGELSFDPSHAQLELEITDDGGVLLHAADTHELVAPDGEPTRSAPQPIYRRVEIRLPHHVLHLDTDFIDAENVDQALDIRAFGQPSQSQTPPSPKPGITGKAPTAAAHGEPLAPQQQLDPAEQKPTRRAEPPVADAVEAPLPIRAARQSQTKRKTKRPKVAPTRAEDEANLDNRPLSEPAKAAILILTAASVILFFMVLNRDWSPASRIKSLADITAYTQTAPEDQQTAEQDGSASAPAEITEPDDSSSIAAAADTQPSNGSTEATVPRVPESRPTSSAATTEEPRPPARNDRSVASANPRPDRTVASRPAGSQATPEAAQPVRRPAQPVSAPLAAEGTTRTTASAEPSPAEPAPDPARLLATADLALAQGRLVTPVEASAFTLYSQVLALDPDSAGAANGIRSIQQQLINQALAQLAQNELLQAERTLTIAENVGADPGLVADLQAEVEFRQRLAAAQNGEFDTIIPVNQLAAIEQRAPRWPRNANGTIAVLFTVTESGEVTDIEILNSPPRNMERAVLRAIRDWRFEPYLYNGRPLPVRSSVAYNLGD